MMKMTRLLMTTLAAGLLTAACGLQHQTNVLAPTSTSAAAPPVSSPTTKVTTTMMGIWTSQTVAPPSPSTCTNFTWKVTGQTATSIQGDFSADCASGMAIAGSASGQLVNGTTVPITVNGTATMPGLPTCSFSLSGTGTLEDNNNALRIPYTGTTCLGPVHGSEVLRRHVDAPAPVPVPGPVPPGPPDPPPGPVNPDAIDLGSATIMNSPNVASWPATAKITLLDLGANGAHVEFTKQNEWPSVRPPGWDGDLQYTLWIVLNINGRWYASGCIEYWRGLDRSGGAPWNYAQDWYYDPARWGVMAGHQPAPGELVGFLVTAGDARNNGVSILHERSNVVAVPFPSGGGSFAFSAAMAKLSILSKR